MASTVYALTSAQSALTEGPSTLHGKVKAFFRALLRCATNNAVASDVLTVIPAAVCASNTLTPGTVVATNTCSVAGQTFTAVASNPAANQFLAGGATTSGPDLARAINASTATKNIVRATASAAGVVTVTCLMPGEVGNKVACTGGTNITIGSGSTLLNGAGTATTYTY